MDIDGDQAPAGPSSIVIPSTARSVYEGNAEVSRHGIEDSPQNMPGVSLRRQSAR
jgi:hypothetical protein